MKNTHTQKTPANTSVFFLRVKKYNMYVCMSVCMHKVTMYKTGAEVKGHCTLAHSSSNLSQRTEKEMKWWSSLVPRPLPDFISQPWKKNWEKAWDHKYVTERKWWTQFVLTESTISSPWHSFDPRPSPDFSPWLRDKIWEWPGDEARL